MAELPRYQQTGRIFADVPQLDFANVRESYRLSQSMTSALDRMSEFAGRFAAKQVEQQAEQFAVENPITIEQLRIAKETGVDPNELIAATGGGAIWQDTLRKFQGEQLRAQLEVFGQSALADIQSQVQTGQLNDINEIKSKFTSAITGYEAPLNRINPESAIRFKQSMAATANAFYKEATKKLEQDYINDQQILSQQNFDVSLKAAKSMINAINDPQMLNEARELMFKRVYEQAREGGTAFAQFQAEKFLKEFDALKYNRLVETATSPDFANDMNTAVQKIKKGDFGDATLLYNEMSNEEKTKVRQNVVSAWNDLYSARKKEDEYNKLVNEEQNKADVVRLYSPGMPQTEKRKLAIDLFKRDAITQSTLDEILNPKDKATDEDNLAEARAESQIISGYIKSERELRQLYPNLSNKNVARLLPKIASTNMQNASKIIRTQAGASESPFAVLDEPTAKRVQDINNIYFDIKSKPNPDGTYVDDVTAANMAAKQYKENSEFKQAQKSQQGTYKSISEKYPDFNPDRMNPQDYARRKGLDDAKLKSLLRLYNSYIQYKNITGLSSEGL